VNVPDENPSGIGAFELVFAAAMVAASGPPIFAAYSAKGSPVFAIGLLVWGLLPIAIAFLIFHLRRQYAAWGWITAVLAYNYFVAANVVQSRSSTAFLDFVWAPLWDMVIVGPIGAFIGVLLARAAKSRKAS
jgi:hypothetical protein